MEGNQQFCVVVQWLKFTQLDAMVHFGFLEVHH